MRKHRGSIAQRISTLRLADVVLVLEQGRIFLPAVEFLGMPATGIVLWFGGRAVIDNQLTIGIVVAFLANVTRFFDPIQELSQLYTTMQSAMAGGERVFELLDTPSDVCDAPNAPEMPRSMGGSNLRVSLSPIVMI